MENNPMEPYYEMCDNMPPARHLGTFFWAVKSFMDFKTNSRLIKRWSANLRSAGLRTQVSWWNLSFPESRFLFFAFFWSMMRDLILDACEASIHSRFVQRKNKDFPLRVTQGTLSYILLHWGQSYQITNIICIYIYMYIWQPIRVAFPQT